MLEKRTIGQTNTSVTAMGFGGAPLGAVGGYLEEDDASALIEHAFQQGINYFDTAPLYGHGLSEKRMGRVLGSLPRGEFVVSTKVGRLLVDPAEGERDPKMRDSEDAAIAYDYSYDGARRSIEASLQRLRLDRIDIAFCHDIDSWTHGADQPRVYREAANGALRALQDMRNDGTIGAFGLGVNEWPVCDRVLDEFDVDCFLLAGRFTLLEQEPLQRFLPRCEARGVSLVIGGPFNSGLLTVTQRRKATFDYQPVDDVRWNKAQAMRAICDAHETDLAAAALQYPLRHPAISAVIPGCWKMRELTENLGRMETQIPDALWRDLDQGGHATYLG